MKATTFGLRLAADDSDSQRGSRYLFRGSLALQQTLRVYLAGGMAVYFYVGKRVSHDLDAEFAGRVLLPTDLTVEIEGDEPVYFDTNFNPMFALVHEHYQRDAVPVDLGVAHIDLRLLAPVDLAVSKIALAVELAEAAARR